MPDPTAQEIATQIGNDLFPEDPSPGLDSKPAGETSSGDDSLIDGQGTQHQIEAAPSPETPPAPLPFTGKALPKAWKKDMQPVWEKLDPVVHDYVYEREENVMRGLQQYQDGYTRWNEVVTPFKPLMEKHPDVNPVQLLQTLMHNHIRLLTGQDKVEHAKRLLESYGITLDGTQASEQPNQEVIALKRELQELKASFGNSQKQAYEAAVAEKTRVVEAFFSDPKNEYANELADDIHKLIQTGVAEDLPSAYERACWLNPVVREKILAKQRQTTSPAAKTPVNIDESGSGKAKPTKPKNWQDSVDDIVSKHYPTH